MGISNKHRYKRTAPIERRGEKKAEETISKGRMYGWELDGDLVSMANASRPTAHNITINYVYTPDKERKKGYATDCVAALSQLMLDSGYRTTSYIPTLIIQRQIKFIKKSVMWR